MDRVITPSPDSIKNIRPFLGEPLAVCGSKGCNISFALPSSYGDLPLHISCQRRNASLEIISILVIEYRDDVSSLNFNRIMQRQIIEVVGHPKEEEFFRKNV
uniref:Uncharacterized protein n=1 Tax=Leptocylindrus danicus TaxID=163516 RepID=A0A7S2JYV4_9STRA|mmetsp:Transcript_14576/g.21556  ORF Transcript_14576/g.21556 Transcript_14576/m.21556 type:complete len:102 (+) Transcript_14576:109-414(+)